MLPGLRLEQYTLRQANIVLLVQARIAGEEDEVIIFRGFSSSLGRPTAFDPDVPVLPATAEILTIDILASPYSPENPRYLQRGLSWADFQPLLTEVGLGE
ncbi:MAG: hypothetical protein ACFCVD_03615 [Nodosilinea sp.]